MVFHYPSPLIYICDPLSSTILLLHHPSPSYYNYCHHLVHLLTWLVTAAGKTSTRPPSLGVLVATSTSRLKFEFTT